MPFPDIDTFIRIGGTPSGKTGSNYSAICKAYAELDRLCDPNIAYNNRVFQDKFEAFYAQVQRFHPNDVGAATPKKTAETSAIRAMQTSAPLKKELGLVRISRLLDKMTTHPLPLVSNTGREIIRKVKERSFNIGLIDIPNVNAQYNRASNTMLINTSVAEKLGMGVIVHEYHHYLTNSEDKYADEFVAHWKQYLAMGLGREKFALINPFLLDDPSGYKLRSAGAIRTRLPFSKPEDAGDLWFKYIDNRKTA